MRERQSFSATLAAALGIAGLALVVLAPAAAHLVGLRPLTGFRLFGLGLLAGLLGLALGALGLVRTRPSAARPGRRRAWLGTVLGLGLVGVLLALALPARDLPRINDITTNPDDPPRLQAAAQEPANRGRDLAYPGADFARMQRAAYPDLAPLGLEAPPEVAFRRARRAAEALGWRITRADPQARVFEAVDVSRIFRFVDDVAVRVRPAGAGSVVDVRSKSRDGLGDLGVNARRIRAFASALREAK